MKKIFNINGIVVTISLKSEKRQGKDEIWSYLPCLIVSITNVSNTTLHINIDSKRGLVGLFDLLENREIKYQANEICVMTKYGSRYYRDFSFDRTIIEEKDTLEEVQSKILSYLTLVSAEEIWSSIRETGMHELLPDN